SSAFLRPAEAALDGFEYRLKSPLGISNPFRLSFATAPIVLGAISGDATPKPQKVTPPCEFVGQFPVRGQSAAVLFEAKKGDIYWIEVFSQRLGFPTDPFMLVERGTKNDKGEESFSTVSELYDSDANLGGVEFNTTSRDPAYRFEAKEDGQYRVQVRDLFNKTLSSSRYPFRLSIRKESPDFRLVAMAAQPPKPAPDSRAAYPSLPNLRRRETHVIKVLAFRRDGF